MIWILALICGGVSGGVTYWETADTTVSVWIGIAAFVLSLIIGPVVIASVD